MSNIDKANEILSDVTGGSSIIIVGRDGRVRIINSDNLMDDLSAIREDSSQFLSRLKDEGVELAFLGLYDEIEVPQETPDLDPDETGYVKSALESMSKMDKSEFSRDQILLLIPIDNLRLSWFRRPFGEPDQIQEIVRNSPITKTLKSSPEGTVNRALIETAISLRSAIL